jgi:hypothetical protein
MASPAAAPVAEPADRGRPPESASERSATTGELPEYVPYRTASPLDAPTAPRPPLTPRRVLGLQRTAGNAAVAAMLGSTAVTVQRDDPPGPAKTIDEQTFVGFQVAAEAAIDNADDDCVDAQKLSNRLGSPYRDRLRVLIDGVVAARNQVSDGMAALSRGAAAPAITGNPAGILAGLDDQAATLRDVCGAWEAVIDSGLAEFLASIGQAQVARARAIAAELDECIAQLRDLQRISTGSEISQAFAQTGLNAAITVAILALTALVPPAGMAVAIVGGAAQIGLDYALGPSDPGKLSFGGVVVSSATAAAEQFAAKGSKLQRAGSRLGAVGIALGTASDLLETHQAIEEYEAAVARIGPLSQRVERLARELDPLLPLLAFPRTAAAFIAALQSSAQTLRENGQLVLTEAGQL